jgi:hypothetical protein
MVRTLPVCALLLILPAPVNAGDPPASAQTVIRLKVAARPAPWPSLRYQLLPELKEIQPGNAVLGYLKCFMEQQRFFFSKEMQDKRAKWEEMPLKDLPVQEIRAAGFNKNSTPLRRADHAARLDHADWQTLLELRKEGVGLLIPEVQQLRVLAAAQVVRFRAGVASGDFEDALTTAQTLLAMARHMGEHPTLITHLVGLAFATMTFSPLEEMLQQPGCPNLYWALTDLPDPLIDIRRAVQGERMLLNSEFPRLSDQRPMTEAELAQIQDRIGKLLEGLHGTGTAGPWPDAQAADPARVRSARQELVSSGLPSDRAERLPALQVILLADKLNFEVQRDEAFKIFALPYWQIEKVSGGSKSKKDSLFAAALLPAALKVRQAQARVQQRIGLLRCVEALRLYAAENDGRLPARLEEIEVPLPPDPVTGRLFVYRLEAGTAILQGTPPAGQEKNAAYNVRYEVTIAR